MNVRPLTDAQISAALRAHLPEAAAPGLRERVFDAVETTAQLRSFPSFLGALSDADPVSRRRSLLIAAALLLALAVASAAAVGAWRLLQRDPIDELSLEPPADLPAFVISTFERLPQLPPVALAWHDSDSNKGRIYVDRSGAVRFDRFTSADATEPSSSTILNPNHRISGMALVGSEAVWIEQGHEAYDNDPRVFIRGALIRALLLADDETPGCEMSRDPMRVGNGTAAAGWRYVGLEYVAGRPTHHVACVGDLWIDIETRLILRTLGPAVDDAGQPIPVDFTEVTEIAFGEQPAALFEPPEGVTRMSETAYSAYLCTRGELPVVVVGHPGITREKNCPTPPEAEATPLPTPTPIPTVRPSLGLVPSGPPGPLAWTRASLKEDWPAPVRPEPAGGASIQPVPFTYLDPTGDTGSDTDPWVDIHGLMADTEDVRLKLVSNQPPAVDPTERWIAYGVVVDDDRDGVPDWRYGIDNTPACDGPPYRVWRTNLHTGHTDAGPVIDTNPRIPVPLNSGPAFQASYPSSYPSGSDASFGFGGVRQVAVPDDEPMPSGGKKVAWGIELDMPFYTWASVIVNGRVVATDFAPDAGWLVATRGAKPGGTFLLGDPFPIPLSMTVPDGWHTGGRGDLTQDSWNAGLAFVIVDKDAGETCGQGTIERLLGPGVDDLVTFLAGLPSIDISENEDVTLDGYRGTYLEFNQKGGTEQACALTTAYPLWDGEGYHQVWILDVDGVRLVIDAFSPLASSESVRAELRQAVESIHFER